MIPSMTSNDRDRYDWCLEYSWSKPHDDANEGKRKQSNVIHKSTRWHSMTQSAQHTPRNAIRSQRGKVIVTRKRLLQPQKLWRQITIAFNCLKANEKKTTKLKQQKNRQKKAIKTQQQPTKEKNNKITERNQMETQIEGWRDISCDLCEWRSWSVCVFRMLRQLAH